MVQRPVGTLRARFSWQGGGIDVAAEGEATLINSNVYQNGAGPVCSLFEPVTFHPSPRWNVTCARGWQRGGGLYIAGTATLTDTNVYANRADEVCSPFELSLSFYPAPRWNVVCARGWQIGGGLNIQGTATLTDTNVYANRADEVCSPFEHIH